MDETTRGRFQQRYILLSVSMISKLNDKLKMQKFVFIRFSLSTKLNPHDLLNAGTHSDEYCYVFRCRRFNEFYKQINANKDSDKDAAITFNAMKNMQALFYNFAKYG